MKKFKHLAVLIAFFLLICQVNFAQVTHRVFDFETVCSPYCLIENGDLPNVETFYGRPKVVDACGGKRLRLNYLSYYYGNYTGGDGVFLNFPFRAGATYRIRYNIYQQSPNQSLGNALPFDLDWILMKDNNNVRTPGNIYDSWFYCGDPRYAVRWGSNIEFLNRLSTPNPDVGGGEYVPVEGASNYCSTQKEFTFQTCQNADRVFIKLDVGGWSSNNISGYSSAEVYLDDITIDETIAPQPPGSDFLLTIIGITTSAHPVNGPSLSRFNFSIVPNDLSADSYKYQVFKSYNSTNNSDLTNDFNPTPIYEYEVTDISNFPLSTSNTRGEWGFHVEENGIANCLYYNIRLTTTKCGVISCTNRVVKSCYNQNILNNAGGSRLYNHFNYEISDQGLGVNRNIIVKCTSSSLNTSNTRNYWRFGSDNSQLGSFANEQTSNLLHPSGILYYEDGLITPKFYRISNEYLNSNSSTLSTKDQLVIYDRYESCGAPSSPNQQISNVLSNGNQIKSLNMTNELKVFPNPLTDQSTIQYTLSKPDKISIYLTDISGKVVKQLIVNKEYETGKYEVPLSKDNISPGLYFIVMNGSFGKTLKKIVVD